MNNKRIRQAALKLMLIQEEYTQKELTQAFAYLSGSPDTFVDLFRQTKYNGNKTSDPISPQAAEKPTKIIRDLQDSDPERYDVLKEFEAMIRCGELLPTMGDIRKLGTSLSKEFQSGKSRNESISRLLAIFASMPIDRMKETVLRLKERSLAVHDADNEYLRLAHFLIGNDKDGNGAQSAAE